MDLFLFCDLSFTFYNVKYKKAWTRVNFRKNCKYVNLYKYLLVTLALVEVHCIQMVTCVGLSHTPLQCACSSIKGQSSCMVIFVPCTYTSCGNVLSCSVLFGIQRTILTFKLTDLIKVTFPIHDNIFQNFPQEDAISIACKCSDPCL